MNWMDSLRNDLVNDKKLFLALIHMDETPSRVDLRLEPLSSLYPEDRVNFNSILFKIAFPDLQAKINQTIDLVKISPESRASDELNSYVNETVKTLTFPEIVIFWSKVFDVKIRGTHLTESLKAVHRILCPHLLDGFAATSAK